MDVYHSRNTPSSQLAYQVITPTLTDLYRAEAMRYSINELRSVFCHFLKESGDCDLEELESAVEEWEYVTLTLDRSPAKEDNLNWSDQIEGVRLPLVKVCDLPDDALWNDILVKVVSGFDSVIEDGVEVGWSWDKILEIYNQNYMIDSAIKRGLDPSVSGEMLLEVVRQDTWEKAMSNKLKARELLARMQGKQEKEISDEEVQNYINSLSKDLF